MNRDGSNVIRLGRTVAQLRLIRLTPASEPMIALVVARGPDPRPGTVARFAARLWYDDNPGTWGGVIWLRIDQLAGRPKGDGRTLRALRALRIADERADAVRAAGARATLAAITTDTKGTR